MYKVRAKCFGILFDIPKALLIDIPKAWLACTYVCMYIYGESRSLIQSFALMCSAIITKQTHVWEELRCMH